MDEQDFKNLISVYQTKYFDSINQNIALEARQLKYKEVIEALNQRITSLVKIIPKPKRATKDTGEYE